MLYHVGPGQRFVYPFHDHDRIVVEPRRAGADGPFVLERLATSPGIFRIEGFLEEWECDSLVNTTIETGRLSGFAKGQADLAKHGSKTAAKSARKVRTSEVGFLGNWLGARTDPAAYNSLPIDTAPSSARLAGKGNWLRLVEQRAADVTGMTVDEQEAIQIVRYYPGQKYSYHTDFALPPQFSQTSNRLLTLFVYLTDVEAGGETHFPLANNPSAQEHQFPPFSDSCDLSQGIHAKPKKGDALLWYTMRVDNQKAGKEGKEARALHAGCPVHEGLKIAVY
eukprot:SAG31_NODE_5434_length_2541_cov_11.784091_2_plen_280_part_00